MKSYADKIQTVIGDSEGALQELSRFIYDHPEIGFEEQKASQKLVQILEKHGFKTTFPLAGMDTAFSATISHESQRPHIAILAEYDALPNLGHACGHNLIATAAVGAGLALKQLIPPLKGRVSVIGTPAEEMLSDSGKMRLVAQGVFNDVDVAMVAHPHGFTWLGKPFLAVNEVSVTFKGKPAHAASSPHLAVNTYDAMQLTFTGLSFLRQQLRQDTRVHWGDLMVGGAKNVIPDVCSATICIRASDDEYTAQVTDKVINCIKGAELMTGCTAEYDTFQGFRSIKLNPYLDALYGENLKDLDVPIDELPQHGRAGSTDMGNVSQVVPSIHPFFKIGDDVVPHTLEFREAAKTEPAFRATLVASAALAMTAADLLSTPERVEKAWEEFRAH